MGRAWDCFLHRLTCDEVLRCFIHECTILWRTDLLERLSDERLLHANNWQVRRCHLYCHETRVNVELRCFTWNGSDERGSWRRIGCVMPVVHPIFRVFCGRLLEEITLKKNVFMAYTSHLPTGIMHFIKFITRIYFFTKSCAWRISDRVVCRNVLVFLSLSLLSRMKPLRRWKIH